MTSPQAGWYQDPQNKNAERYWDGTQWTNQTQQAATPPPPPPPGSYQAPSFPAPGIPTYQGYSTPQQGSYAAEPVSFPEAVKRLCTKWTTRGRASRSEYWFAALVYFVLYIASSLFNVGSSAVNLVVGLVTHAALLNLLFIAVRRYHDSGKSGVWVLLQVVINIVSMVVVLISVVGAAFSAFGGSESDVTSFGAVAVVGALVLLANTIWAIVWLSLPAKPEKNQYDH